LNTQHVQAALVDDVLICCCGERGGTCAPYAILKHRFENSHVAVPVSSVAIGSGVGQVDQVGSVCDVEGAVREDQLDRERRVEEVPTDGECAICKMGVESYCICSSIHGNHISSSPRRIDKCCIDGRVASALYQIGRSLSGVEHPYCCIFFCSDLFLHLGISVGLEGYYLNFAIVFWEHFF
jgi:hypothetical protein